VKPSGEVALEAAQRALLGLALALFASEVLLGSGIVVRAVIAMMCSAWLSWRSPPRLSRYWVRCPEETSCVNPQAQIVLLTLGRPAPPGAGRERRSGQGGGCPRQEVGAL